MTRTSKRDHNLARRLYRSMLNIRLVEEGIAERYEEQEMRCPVHLSIGQEAAAAGVGLALHERDRIFSTHRSHAHYLAKGGDLRAMLAEIYGKAGGCVGGRGGSMHLMDPNVGMMASIPIVGSCIPLAVGTALSDALDGNDRVSIAYLGDASIEEGVFHESANFARLRDLPVLFICENNLYSVYSHLGIRQPDRPLIAVAAAHDIRASHHDGNDVEAVHRATIEAAMHARSGEGPSFLLFDTYRWREHCGPNYDNHIGYREEQEYETWRERDPLSTYQAELLCDGTLSHNDIEEMENQLKADIDAAFEFAKTSPLPDSSTAHQHVYA